MVFLNYFAAITLLLFSLSKENYTQLPKTKIEILTAQTWIVKESVDMENETYNFYRRGANNNTHDLKDDELTFAVDHSGLYKDATGSAYTLKWEFTNIDETEMNVLIQYPQPVILHYQMIQLAEGQFSATHTYINGSGDRVLASFQRIYKNGQNTTPCIVTEEYVSANTDSNH